MARARQFCRIIEPGAIVTPAAIRDPDDLAVLACAVAADADAIVTGDDDLLTLRSFRRIPILTAVQALERLRK